MAIEIPCFRCGTQNEAPDEAAGTQIECSACGESIDVPALVDEEAELSEAASQAEAGDDSPSATRRAPEIRNRRQSLRKALMTLAFLAAIGGLVWLSFRFPKFGYGASWSGVVIGIGVTLFGLGWMMMIPFGESFRCGLKWLFLPFYGVYYFFSRLNDVFRPTLTAVGGVAIATVGLNGVEHFYVPAGRPSVALDLKLPTRKKMQSPEPSTMPHIPLPSFPTLGSFETYKYGVRYTELTLQAPPNQPGRSGNLRIYLPDGEHPPRSLPCVLVGPAGRPSFLGRKMHPVGNFDQVAFAKAGFVVVAFEVDGPLPEKRSGVPDALVRQAMARYATALAGLVNARNALEFAVARIPEVDRERIYTAGYGSAGSLSLLLAEHEPRLKGCVALAPVTDLKEDNHEWTSKIERWIPGFNYFLTLHSPVTHPEKTHCPVFIWHARKDEVIPVEHSVRLAESLQELGKPVTVEIIPGGDHHDSVISEGIGAAVKWLSDLDRRNVSETVTADAGKSGNGA